MQKIGHKQLFLDHIDSTNKFLLDELAYGQKEHGMVVYTYDQRAGRGQRQNIWESEAYKNLAISVLLTDALPSLENQFILTALGALAVVDFVEMYSSQAISVKWPNDIIISDKKIAGILIENTILTDRLRESVMGIGINIYQEAWPNIPHASSMKNHSENLDKDLRILTQEFINSVEKLWNEYINGEDSQLWKRYNDLLYRKDQKVNLQTPKGNLLVATVKSVNRKGELEVMDEEGVSHRFKHGEILWSL